MGSNTTQIGVTGWDSFNYCPPRNIVIYTSWEMKQEFDKALKDVIDNMFEDDAEKTLSQFTSLKEVLKETSDVKFFD